MIVVIQFYIVCLGSAVGSVMDPHSYDRGSNPGQGKPLLSPLSYLVAHSCERIIVRANKNLCALANTHA